MSNKPLFYGVAAAIFLVALLFCHAYELDNSFIYIPIAIFLGFKISMSLLLYFMPTAFDPEPTPEPKTRQEKKKAAKDAEALARRNEKNAKKEADAARKATEARS
ncbi:hypothetical protein BGZ76_003480 [Entomortierella beljakovae]|nr:hypothetical protein BGZ76_003480 [Entomortierella beljakovae]